MQLTMGCLMLDPTECLQIHKSFQKRMLRLTSAASHVHRKCTFWHDYSAELRSQMRLWAHYTRKRAKGNYNSTNQKGTDGESSLFQTKRLLNYVYRVTN